MPFGALFRSSARVQAIEKGPIMATGSHRALKITGIVLGAVVGIALIAVLALNLYMRTAFAPFFDQAEAQFEIPGLNSGFVPQDLDHVEADDSWLFSGYMTDGSPSPLYRRTADGTVQTLYVTMPDGSTYNDHGSAVTSNEEFAYLACEDGYVMIPMDDLIFAEDGQSVKATQLVNLDFTPAFMNIEEDQLLAGNFYFPGDYETPDNHHITTPDGTENPAVMYAFPQSPQEPGQFSTVPDSVYSIPGMVQGTCRASDGKLVLSTSYGIAPSHLLAYDVNLGEPDGTFTTNAGDSIPLYCLDSRNLATDVEGPPMQEGIESHEGRVFTTDESASNKYIFGKLCGAGQVYALAL